MKPGLKKIIAGILIFLFGAFIVPVIFILPILQGGSDKNQFTVPGSMEIEIDKPGRYYLWNDFKTIYEGKSYNRSENIPDGLEITVTSEAGEALAFKSSSSISSTSGSHSKNSIGYVEVEQPGQLTISVSGEAEQRVFSFARSGIMKILGLIFGGLGASILTSLAGIGILVWGIIALAKDSNRKNAQDHS